MTGNRNIPGTSTGVSRRAFCGIAGGAFGLIPLTQLMSEEQSHAQANQSSPSPARIRRVIFLFMNGGPSQVDTFDPKPALDRFDGSEYAGSLEKIASGDRVAGTLWRSEFQFSPRGESGLEISELYPELGAFADDLCIIRSMRTQSALHAPAILKMNTGHERQGRSSLGSWIQYGLGAVHENLPAYVVMLDPRGGPVGGHGNWSAGMLPTPPATVLHSTETPILNLSRRSATPADDEARMRDLLVRLNEHHRQRDAGHSEFAMRMRAYESAWQMQQSAPDAIDLSQETDATRRRYGLNAPLTEKFGSRCLLARRLLERGVRFVQIYSGGGDQKTTWDSHVANVERHRQFAGETDRPIAALLEDLKARGLWDDTLVLWGGEFGRTPTREHSSRGRDHNPHGFSMWLAGGAIRGGQAIGATDELGFEAVENVCTVSDLHATILHLLGIDHTVLSFVDNGLEQRLTGPEPCRVIEEVLA